MPTSQAAQAKVEFLTQDEEDAAIQLHVSTMSPQTPYSAPQLAWRPDGTGVWVNGDDGAVKGLETQTGKVISVLKGGHDSGSKIRTICCGYITVGEKKEEWVISGGFDRKLIAWRP